MLCSVEWKDNPTSLPLLPSDSAAPPPSKHTHLWNLSGWAEEAHETDPVSPHLSKPMGMYRVIYVLSAERFSFLCFEAHYLGIKKFRERGSGFASSGMQRIDVDC